MGVKKSTVWTSACVAEILYTPASSAVSKPTSTFGSFCRANFPSTASSAAGLSLLAQPAAFTCSVSRIVFTSAMPSILAVARGFTGCDPYHRLRADPASRSGRKTKTMKRPDTEVAIKAAEQKSSILKETSKELNKESLDLRSESLRLREKSRKLVEEIRKNARPRKAVRSVGAQTPLEEHSAV